MGQGQRSRWSRSTVKWVKPGLRVMILAGGLTPTSSCIFHMKYKSHSGGNYNLQAPAAGDPREGGIQSAAQYTQCAQWRSQSAQWRQQRGKQSTVISCNEAPSITSCQTQGVSHNFILTLRPLFISSLYKAFTAVTVTFFL